MKKKFQCKGEKTIVWCNIALNQSGGGERLSLEVVRSLQDAGLDAKYLVYDYDSRSTFEGRYDSVKPIARTLDQGIGSGLKWRISNILWMRKMLKRIQPDWIITSGTWGQVVDVYLSTLFLRINYATHIFGSMFAFTPQFESLKYSLVFRNGFKKVLHSVKSYSTVVPEALCNDSISDWLIRNAKGLLKFIAVRSSSVIFVLSERNRWETSVMYGRDAIVLQGAFPARIWNHVIVNNVKSQFGLYNKKVVLSIGRLVKNKRVDLAIQSMAIVCKTDPDVYLLIGGSGPEESALKKLAYDLNIQDQVRFIGYVPESLLWDYMATCDTFLHLDLADYDIAPMEALAMGADVIWTNEIDVPNVAKSIDGVWCVEPDCISISDAVIKSISQNPSKRIRNQRKNVLDSYTWENYSEQMIRFMQKSVANKDGNDSTNDEVN